MDTTQLNTEIQKLIENSPDKALQNVLDYLQKVRTSPSELENASFASPNEKPAETAVKEFVY